MAFKRGLFYMLGTFAFLLSCALTALWLIALGQEAKHSKEEQNLAPTLYATIIPNVLFCDGARSPLRYKSNEFTLVAPTDALLIDEYQRTHSLAYKEHTVAADVALVRDRAPDPITFVLIARKEHGFCALGIVASGTVPLFREIADRNK
jgi:hypothetical protein